MSTREIAIAVTLTVVACVFILAALFGPSPNAPASPEPTASAGDTAKR